ncbi:MAG: DUF1292 domain-containing protein [Lachnospiraceae bacterium]
MATETSQSDELARTVSDAALPITYTQHNKTNKETNMAENNFAEEEMTVDLELEDGEKVTCAVITILTVEKKDYIVLLPLDENGENSDGEVWFYGYKEDESDPNAEPELIYIESDEEYEAVSDAFDEYLDNQEFDELVDDGEES